MPIQDDVAIILPKTFLRKTSPAVTLAKGNVPEKYYKILWNL